MITWSVSASVSMDEWKRMVLSSVPNAAWAIFLHAPLWFRCCTYGLHQYGCHDQWNVWFQVTLACLDPWVEQHKYLNDSCGARSRCHCQKSYTRAVDR